jgi:hypothetical protein
MQEWKNRKNKFTSQFKEQLIPSNMMQRNTKEQVGAM